MFRTVATFALALTLTSCATGQNAETARGDIARAPWHPVDGTTGQIDDVEGLQRLAEAFPDSASVRLRLLNAHIAAGEPIDGARQVIWLANRDYEFSATARAQMIEMLAEAGETALDRAIDLEVEPVGTSDIVAETTAQMLLPETVLHDPEHDRLLLTTVVSRALFAKEGEGAWREVPLRMTGSLSGMALDPERNLIWIASGVFEQTPEPESAWRGLIALDRETLRERRRLPMPNGATASDIAVGPDGCVYASDPMTGIVWKGCPHNSGMQAFVSGGTFRSPQGIAVLPDNSALLVSDYRYGIARVELPGGAVSRITTRVPTLLDGTDGMWLRGSELVAIQNGIRPISVSAFGLDGERSAVRYVRKIERANGEWREPIGGSISGRYLYYVDSDQWSQFGEGGLPNDGARLRPAVIRRTPLVIDVTANGGN